MNLPIWVKPLMDNRSMVNPQRVLITGCGGMLGSAIYPYFERRCRAVFATDRYVTSPWIHELDVCDTQSLREAFHEVAPDFVLHLAAETNLEYCETHPIAAERTNSLATRTVARLARDHDCVMVYISTAGVFDGEKQGNYTEADEPRPIMVYGRTKLDGEHHVREIWPKHYIVRAGWMVGGGPGKDHKFVGRILGQILEGRRVIHAVSDRLGSPTYSRDFASNLFALLASQRYGTYHMVCEGQATRYEVAQEIVSICGRTDIEVMPVDSSFFAEEFFAPRPRSEMMENANLTAAGLNFMRPWRQSLCDYVIKTYGSRLRAAANGQDLQQYILEEQPR